VLRAVQVIVDEGIAKPILIGHPGDIARKLEAANLRVRPGIDFEVICAGHGHFFDEHFEAYWQEYRRLMERKGVSADFARREVRRRPSLFGALMVRQGDADGLICGTFGRHRVHREHVENVIGLAPGVKSLYAMSVLLLLAAALQIGNTIRMAAFARRRELGIMRLVGASNLYIMLPFLLESLFAALIGAALACASLAAFTRFVIIDRAQVSLKALRWIGWSETSWAMAGVVMVAVVLSLVPTLFATRRYVRV